MAILKASHEAGWYRVNAFFVVICFIPETTH
jgi:hypothetical protein